MLLGSNIIDLALNVVIASERLYSVIFNILRRYLMYSIPAFDPCIPSCIHSLPIPIHTSIPYIRLNLEYIIIPFGQLNYQTTITDLIAYCIAISLHRIYSQLAVYLPTDYSYCPIARMLHSIVYSDFTSV